MVNSYLVFLEIAAMACCGPGGGLLFWRIPADQGAELTSSQIHNLEYVL